MFHLWCKLFEIVTFFLLFLPYHSKFRDIFDEDFFIHALKNDVDVVPELPRDVLEQFDNNISSIVNLRVKAWSSPTYYLQKVLPKLRQMRYAVTYIFYIMSMKAGSLFSEEKKSWEFLFV